MAVLLALPVGYFAFNIASTLCTISSNCGVGGSGALPNNGGTTVSGTIFVLLMGSDERHDAQGKIVSGQVPHSDTMILAAVDTDHKRVRLLSVPRDLVATIPGYGPLHRINEAYTIGETKHLPGGGPALAVKTMEQLTGINIPYYAVTTFQGFRQTVDAVGGVSIDVDRPITDHDYPGEGDDFRPVYVAAGPQVMGGEKALEYVRSRHDDPLGDFGRNQRQQKFLGALTQKLLQPSRIGQFQQFMDIVKINIRTNLSPAQILSMAQSMVSVGKGHLQSYAVGPNFVSQPTFGPYSVLGAVLVPDKAAMSELVSAFIRGDPPPTPSGTPAAPP
ncbi:MAG TPA: LCP family protein [Candidatus Solibacter sp.]|nr:LCP family protein [Candidatus Solibacter sp.]